MVGGTVGTDSLTNSAANAPREQRSKDATDPTVDCGIDLGVTVLAQAKDVIAKANDALAKAKDDVLARAVSSALSTKQPADDDIERIIESDPSLVPTGNSKLLVAPRVLDEAEVQALLDGLTPLLEELTSEAGHESHTASVGCSRSNSQLSPLAWLFPNHAGAGRPARHKQGYDLRARRRSGKKARSAPRQAQGSLFGDHR
jgi:hypothetical protein